jgi:hypothetical protein
MTLASKLGTQRRAELALANGGFAQTVRHGASGERFAAWTPK